MFFAIVVLLGRRDWPKNPDPLDSIGLFGMEKPRFWAAKCR